MTIELITKQCILIADKANLLQNLLKSPQIQKFYLENTDKQTALLDAIEINSGKLVLWGMKSFYNSDTLPSNEELYVPNKSTRKVGDVLLTWANFYAGPPRVIDAYDPEKGYNWHYLDEPDTVRPPIKYDKFFQHYSLFPMEFKNANSIADQIEQIQTLQEFEIENLNSYIELFETKQYRDL